MSAFKSCQIILLFEQYTHSQEDDLWFSYFEVAPLRCEVFREVTFHEWAALCSLLYYICCSYTLLYSAPCFAISPATILCYTLPCVPCFTISAAAIHFPLFLALLYLLLYSALTATELLTLFCACFTLQPATYHRKPHFALLC